MNGKVVVKSLSHSSISPRNSRNVVAVALNGEVGGKASSRGAGASASGILQSMTTGIML